jgi:hypothetical protein
MAPINRSVTRAMRRAARVTVAASAVLLACGSPAERDAFGGVTAIGDLHSTCDAAIGDRPATAATDHVLALDIDSPIPLPAEIARVMDIVVSSTGNDIYVLDMRNAQIARLDSSGRLQQVLGRPGQGPGDLSFTPMSSTAIARMVLIDDTLLVAFDERSFKAYSREGRVRWDRAVSQFALANRDGMHTSPARSGTLRFSESGKYRMRDTVRNNRTSLELRSLELSSLTSTTTARAQNNWVLLPPFTGFPPQQPYISEYKRAWDGTASRIAVYSYRRYGVCFFHDSGALVNAIARDIVPPPIDAEEQERAMKAEFRVNDVDARLPMLHRSAREMFADKWPAHAPLYTDIVLDPDGSALVLRRVSPQRVVVDVFDESSGYVGSFEPPLGRLPRRITSGRAIVADNEELTLLRYRWVSESLRAEGR